MAFIKGFYDLGYDVTVISKCTNADIIDESISLPDEVDWRQYKTSRLYSRNYLLMKNDVIGICFVPLSKI